MAWADHARTIASHGRHINEEVRPRVVWILGEDVLNWEDKKYDYKWPGQPYVNWRIATVLIFTLPAVGALGVTLFVEHSVAGSSAAYWVAWVMGIGVTTYLGRMLLRVPASAPKTGSPPSRDVGRGEEHA